MRALRGAGTSGLAAIAPVRGRFVRPLLDVGRMELREWLAERGLAWREDPTNDDTSFERNWIRHELIPLISRRRPGASKSLARAATLARADEHVLDALADDVVERAQTDAVGVLLEGFDLLPSAIASRAVRKVCWTMGEDPSFFDVTELLEGRRCGSLVAQLLPEGLAIVRDPVPVPQPLPLAEHTEIASSEWGVRVRVGTVPAGSALRSRRPGDRVRTARGTRKVQDVLVDAKVPRVLRDLVPIVANAEGAVAVVGQTVPDTASGIVIDVEPYEPTWSRAAWWSRATS
jgi:tRNA(Ile)-lysidine synthase